MKADMFSHKVCLFVLNQSVVKESNEEIIHMTLQMYNMTDTIINTCTSVTHVCVESVDKQEFIID